MEAVPGATTAHSPTPSLNTGATLPGIAPRYATTASDVVARSASSHIPQKNFGSLTSKYLLPPTPAGVGRAAMEMEAARWFSMVPWTLLLPMSFLDQPAIPRVALSMAAETTRRCKEARTPCWPLGKIACRGSGTEEACGSSTEATATLVI